MTATKIMDPYRLQLYYFPLLFHLLLNCPIRNWKDSLLQCQPILPVQEVFQFLLQKLWNCNLTIGTLRFRRCNIIRLISPVIRLGDTHRPPSKSISPLVSANSSPTRHPSQNNIWKIIRHICSSSTKPCMNCSYSSFVQTFPVLDILLGCRSTLHLGLPLISRLVITTILLLYKVGRRYTMVIDKRIKQIRNFRKLTFFRQKESRNSS